MEEKNRFVSLNEKGIGTKIVSVSAISSIVSVDSDHNTWRVTLKEINDKGQNESFLIVYDYKTLLELIPELAIRG